MNKIKFAFSDGGHFCQKLIFKLLSNEYECIIDNNNPDILIYSPYGNIHRKYSCKKLFINCENSYFDFNECDYAIGTHYLTFGNRYCRIPFFVFNKEYQLLCNNSKVKVDNRFNRKFCSAIVSNNLNADPIRAEFIRKINSIKHIDSVGKALNTTGYTLPNRLEFAENFDGVFTNPSKIMFMSQYKFNIAMENSQVEGYCTEKITDAFAANTIPIYFGDTKIYEEFNKDAFINISSFDSLDSAIQYILKLDNNKEEYLKMLDCNINIHKDYLDKLHNFIINVINGKIYEHRYGNIINQLRKQS